MHGVISHAAVRSSASLLKGPVLRPLSQLVSDGIGEIGCIHPGSPRRSRILQLESIRDRYTLALTERWGALRRMGLQSEALRACSGQAEYRAVSALGTLLEYGPNILGWYESDQSREESPRMTPERARGLRAESCDTFKSLLTRDPVAARVAATYRASIDPALRDDYLGPAWRTATVREAGQEPPLPQRIDACLSHLKFTGLSDAEMLVLRLYAHPDSGAFNLLRACDEIRHLPGGGDALRGIDEISALLTSATGHLYELPAARVGGVLFKGMQSRGGGTWEIGDELVISRPFSATALEDQSYAGRVVHGVAYDEEFVLKDNPDLRTKAVLIAPFHPPCTADQYEALVLPGQMYRIVQCTQRELGMLMEGGSMAIDRYVAEKAADVPGHPWDPPQSGSGLDRAEGH